MLKTTMLSREKRRWTSLKTNPWQNPTSKKTLRTTAAIVTSPWTSTKSNLLQFLSLKELLLP
jgi:hypothetical protein